MNKSTLKPRRKRAPSRAPEKPPPMTYDRAEALFYFALYEREKVRALAEDESAHPVFRKIAQGELQAVTDRASHARELCEALAPIETAGEPTQ